MSKCRKETQLRYIAYSTVLLVCRLFYTVNMSYIVRLHSLLRLVYFLVIQTSLVNKRST